MVSTCSFAYVLLLLSAMTVACVAPLTRYATTSASQYTYHVLRSCVSGLIGVAALATTSDGGLRELVGTAKSRPWFLCFGVIQWFYLWAYLHAMQSMAGSTWAAIHYCTYPIFAGLIGLCASGESPSWGYFAYTCCRNIFVIVMTAGSVEARGHWHMTPGFGFVLLTAACQGCGVAVIRQIRGSGCLAPMVWSDTLNTLLWVPPGILGVRAPFLWPDLEVQGGVKLHHHLDLPPRDWICLIATGFFAAAGVISMGVALRYLNAANVSVFNAPLSIICTALVEAIFTVPPSIAAAAGILCFCCCSAAEYYFGVLPEASKDTGIAAAVEANEGERQRLVEKAP